MTTVLTIVPLGLKDSTIMQRWCKGWAVRDGRNAKPVPTAADLKSIPETAATLDRMIKDELAAGNDVVVFGHSEGSQTGSYWLREYAHRSDAPDPRRVRFVFTGNPESAVGHPPWVPGGNATGLCPEDTPYRVLEIGRQWDGWCRWSWNPRSIMGMLSAHADYYNIDIDNLNPLKQWTVGNTTYVTVP